jgi:hypothetical protein
VNSNLYGKNFAIPDDVRKHMSDMFAKHSQNTQSNDGLKRNRQLQNAQSISYSQAKRIKNFFDTYKGATTSPEYNLNGGEKMKTFVNSILSGARRGIEGTQNTKRDTGMQMDREYLAQPADMNMSPSNSHKNTIEKNLNEEVTQNLKRINEIMEKLWQH